MVALRYHPDRTHGNDDDVKDDNSDGEGAPSTTLKFQAVSAAYQVLMDEGRRSCYDRTGEVCEDDDCNHGDGFPSPSTAGPPSKEGDGRFKSDESSRQRRSHNGGGQDWEFFFRSVFDEMVGAGARHRLRRKGKGEEKMAHVTGNVLATTKR